MSDIQSKVPAADDMPSPEELLIHILFDFLSHFLLVRSILESMVDHVLGLVFYFRLHLREQCLHSPLLRLLLHYNDIYNFLEYSNVIVMSKQSP